MLKFDLSLVPFLSIGVVNFVLSWLYYSPIAPWFKAWQKGVGVDPNKKTMTPEEAKMMPFMFGGAFLATFVISYGLQVVIHSIGASDFATGAVVGVVAWATFALTHSLNTMFEGRKPVVLVINNVLYLVTYALYGGIIAVWK